ncbi:MAG: glycosyltransferase [Terriglobales bacterium]
MPLVSVLMTAYNREAFIADAIASVLAQRFTDFELIIVDDASRDRTVEIARDLAARDGAVVVPLLQAYPQASIALSPGGRDWASGPCPMLLTPRMAYQREFLGDGIFNLGPACALFRSEDFRKLGYFPLWGAASDYVFWLHACTSVQVLLVPGGMFWYRIHAGQELVSARAQFDYMRAAHCGWEALLSPACPLEPEEVEAAKRNWAWAHGRVMLGDLRRLRFHSAWERWRNLKLGLPEWLRYFRRQRRSPFAGTPVDANGQFIVPDWNVFESSQAVRGRQ